jgi:ABC-type spermidine/putrescine transport system permease subunit II
MYGIIMFGSFALLIVMLIPMAVLTLFSFEENEQVYL